MPIRLAPLVLVLCGFDWNVPDAVAWAEVGERIQANGMPMKIFVARTKRSPVAVLRHYEARFLGLGFFLPPVPLKLQGLELPRVTALDTKTLWSYLVYAYPEPDGTTTLVMGAADLKGRVAGKKGDAFPAPTFPAAKTAFSANVEFARTLTFVTTATEEEVVDFYRQTLPSGGWKERERGAFVREGRLLRMLGKSEGKVLRVVLVEEADQPALTKPSAEGK